MRSKITLLDTHYTNTSHAFVRIVYFTLCNEGAHDISLEHTVLTRLFATLGNYSQCYSIIYFNNNGIIVIRIIDAPIVEEQLHLSSSQVQLWSILQFGAKEGQRVQRIFRVLSTKVVCRF